MNKILIVDDHPVLRRGLTSLISAEPDLTVCGEAGSRSEATELIRQTTPDLMTVDIVLQDGDGLELVKETRRLYPKLPMLVLSMHDEAVYAERSLRAGAFGYVTKQQLDDTVLIAIRRILAGETYMSDELKARLAQKFINGQSLLAGSAVSMLSDRQLQVFRLIGQGRSTRQIAQELHLSVKTIESHREYIKRKLELATSAELARRATQWVEHTG